MVISKGSSLKSNITGFGNINKQPEQPTQLQNSPKKSDGGKRLGGRSNNNKFLKNIEKSMKIKWGEGKCLNSTSSRADFLNRLEMNMKK
jgi:hypothetical protein